MRELGFAGLFVAFLVGCASPRSVEEIAAEPTATGVASTPVPTTVATTSGPASSPPPATSSLSELSVPTSAPTTAPYAGLCAPAPADATDVSTGPEWELGEIRLLEIESGRSTDAAGRSGGLAVTPVELEVIAVEPDGYRFAWRAGTASVVVAGASPATAEAAEELLAELPTPEIVYSITRDHAFVGIENIDEMRAHLIASVELLGERGVLPDDETLGRVRSLYETLDDAQIEQLLSEEIQVLHLFDGIELAAGAPVEFDDLLANALGGEPFPAVTAIELTRMVDEDGCVEIVQTTTPHPERFGEILAESIVAAGLVPADTPIDEAELVFEVDNRIIAQYDHVTGRPRQIRATQRVTVETTTQTDTVIIRDRTDD